MVYEGYTSFGGNEIVNSERTRGYAETFDCPVNWFVGDECEGLGEALGHADYVAGNIPLAPWYDISLPDLSGRFLGVHGISLSGLNSSTRSADITEGISDGGVIGRTRKGARSVRARAILTAKGRDALDYGISWLSSALDPGACGQHGSECGTTDMEFFTECPPARGVVQALGEWTVAQENVVANPSFESNLNIPVGAVRSSDWSASGSYSIFVPTAAGYGHVPYGHTNYGHGPVEEI